jgi:hypothetical protein
MELRQSGRLLLRRSGHEAAPAWRFVGAVGLGFGAHGCRFGAFFFFPLFFSHFFGSVGLFWFWFFLLLVFFKSCLGVFGWLFCLLCSGSVLAN